MSLNSDLQQLSELRGISGDERAVRKWIEDAIRDHVDEMRVDTMGNLLAVKNGRGKGRRMRVLLDAHMDEVGMMVVGYNGNGVHYRRKTDEVAKGGYQEFKFA